MKIETLDLIAYGPFTDMSLDFSAEHAGLHVVYGNNEAGKSSSLRALIAWLFGIPGQTKDNFIHKNPTLRIGGTLSLAGGEKLGFIRCKRNKDALLDLQTNEPIDDGSLGPFLAGIDKDLFTRMYGISHQQLTEGGEELLSQSGDLGQALVSASGTANPRTIFAELRASAEALFTPRGSTKPVNEGVKKYKEATKQIKESSLLVSVWNASKKELAQLGVALKDVEENLGQRAGEQGRLDRLHRIKGALGERREVLRRLKDLEQALLLPDSFGEDFRGARNALQHAKDVAEKATAKLARRKEDAASLTVREELLANEDAILALFKGLGAVEKSVKDRPLQEGKRIALRDEATKLLKSVRPELSIKEADQLRPLANNRTLIGSLTQQHGLLEQKQENGTTAQTGLQNDRRLAQSALDLLGQPIGDLAALKGAIAVARETGNLEERLAAAESRAADDGHGCEEQRQRLGRFSGTVEQLAGLALPVPETLELFDGRFEELDRQRRDHHRGQEQLTEERRQAEEKLRDLLLAGDVPSDAELALARTERDNRWGFLRRKYVDKQKAETGDAVDDRYAAESDVAATYESNVRQADDVSDRLRSAAERVHQRAHLEGEIENKTKRLADLGALLNELAGHKAALSEEWQTLWSPLSVEPASPREMKQWLSRADKLLALHQSAVEAARDGARLTAERNRHRQALIAQLANLGDAGQSEDISLSALLSHCEARVHDEEAAAEERRQLQRSLQEIESRLTKAAEDLTSIESDRAKWQEAWNGAIAGLGLKSDASPLQVNAVFDQLVEFLKKLDQAEDLQRRIYGIDKDVDEFEKSVFNFLDDVGIARDGQEATLIVAQLNRELGVARESKASLHKIRTQMGEIDQELVEATATIQSAEKRLLTLREQANVASNDALEQAAELSGKKRAAQARRDALELELTRNGDGHPIAELEQQAADSNLDALEGQRQSVTSELASLRSRRDQLRDQLLRVETQMKANDGSTVASEASEEAEQQLAAVRSGVEQYLRLQIASLILEQQIEIYRKANQGPVLSRASVLFQRLTLGSFSGLRDELEDGKPVILGLRSDDTEVTVAGMSDGTRDQLYLALRIATLEQRLGGGEPMPFIVDDILIGFDDDRTRVCLEVLAELGLRTQVLLFTHHKRVVELALEVKQNGGGLLEHRLG